MNKELIKKVKSLAISGVIICSIGTQSMIFADNTNSSAVITTSNMNSEYNNKLPTFTNLDIALKSGNSEFRVTNDSKSESGPVTDWKLIETNCVNAKFDFGKHPQAENGYYYASAYYFSFDSKVSYSPNISITGFKGAVSVSVDKQLPSGGYAVYTGNQNKKSLPISRGELYKSKWTVKTYSPTGNLISTETKYTCRSENVQGFFKFV